MTPNQEARSALTIVGPGRLGQSVHHAAMEAGLVAQLADRESAFERTRGADIVLLCVPDSEIAFACEALFGSSGDKHDFDLPSMVGHTSGATALGALRSASGAGASTFSLHPLQTIPDGETDLTGMPCAVSADSDPARVKADELTRALGMVPFAVPEESRAAYHAAAVIASNYLVAIEEAAVSLLDSAGVPNGRALLSPLVLETARNWSERGAEALTGPISRDDHETVRRHLAAIDELEDPELLDAYSNLAVLTGRINSDRVRSSV